MADPGGADDVVQDSFVKAYKALKGFRGESSFKSWLLRIVANTAKNALRSRARHSGSDLDSQPLAYIHEDFGRLESGQRAKLLKEAVAKLAPKQKMALELRIFEELSFKEVASVMNCPFDTAKANFRHALMNLRKIIQGDEFLKGELSHEDG